MDPTNPSPHSFIYHFSKDPTSHESLIHRAMNENPEGSKDEIYNDMIKEKPFLEKNKDFNKKFSVYYHSKPDKMKDSAAISKILLNSNVTGK